MKPVIRIDVYNWRLDVSRTFIFDGKMKDTENAWECMKRLVPDVYEYLHNIEIEQERQG